MMSTAIQLTHGYSAIVDDQDADLGALHWQARIRPAHNSTIYAQRVVKKWNHGKYDSTTVVLHRLVLGRMLGRELSSTDICDHKDGNGLNCQRNNLRLATETQNQINRGPRRHNKSGFKGVSASGKRWEACIRLNGKSKHLGTFNGPIEAFFARAQAEVDHYGEYASRECIDAITLGIVPLCGQPERYKAHELEKA